MKGSEKVTTKLQELLSYELASIHQYLIHSEIYEEMGLQELYARIHHEMGEEHGHAQLLIRRLLFLEKTPNVENIATLMVGSNVQEMLENDLKLELAGREIILQGIKICEEEGDYESREVLEKLLNDTEEDHIYWLERQIKLIGMVGLPNYLQKKMGGGEG